MRSLLFYFSNTLLLCLLAFSITAQDEDVPISDLGTISNEGDIFPKIYELCLDENKEITFKVEVLLDNLPVEGGMGFYPPNDLFEEKPTLVFHRYL